MIKEEAIEVLKDIYNYTRFDTYTTNEARTMAIKALEQEPCEDVVSRQAMHIELEKWITYGEYKYSNATKYLYDRIDRLPPVTPQPKMGKWLHRENMDYLDKNKVIHNHFMCQDCGFIHDFIDGHTAQYNYCPNCGAKMESEDKE